MPSTLARVEQQIPAAVGAGSLVDAAGPAPRRRLALRALDEAFLLDDASSFPRDRAAFTARLDAGSKRLPALLSELGRLAQEIGVELDRARAAVRTLDGKPGAPRASLDDVRAQLTALVTPSLLAWATRERLAHVPRYLRAVQLRLSRLPNGPQKDQRRRPWCCPSGTTGRAAPWSFAPAGSPRPTSTRSAG